MNESFESHRRPDDADSPSFIERRLERHLRAHAADVPIRSASPGTAKRRARERTIRRRRAVVGGVAAASVVGVVAGVQVLSDPGPSTIQTVDTPTVDSSAPVVDSTSPVVVAQPTTTVASPAPIAEGIIAAQLEDPAFVWKVVEPGKDHAIGGTFFGRGANTLPTLAISTAPGRSNDYDNVESVVWRTDDGIEWDQTDITSPFDQTFWQPQFVGDTVFAVGTAPGIAATEENPLRVATRTLDGEWVIAQLPVDANQTVDLRAAYTGTEISQIPLDEGLLVSVTSRIDVDYEEVARAAGIDFQDLRFWQNIEGGISVTDPDCAESQFEGQFGVPTTIVLSATGESVGQANDSLCERTTYTWEELGVPSETIEAMRAAATRLFTVDTDANVTEIDPPVPGIVLQPVDFVSARFFDRDAWQLQPEGVDHDEQEVFEYDFETGWTTTTAPSLNLNWSNPPSVVGDATMGFSYSGQESGTPQTVFVTIDADDTVTSADLAGMVDDDRPFLEVSTSNVEAAGRYVAAVQQYPDPVTDAGGVETTAGGVTIRKESSNGPYLFFDTESGAELTDAFIQYPQNDSGDLAQIVDSTGDVLAELSGEALYEELEGSLDFSNQRPPTQRILTTADGVNFSSESVADLLGLDDSDVSRVQRMTSDGNQVFIAVALEERHPDDTRKQLVLVGTPIG